MAVLKTLLPAVRSAVGRLVVRNKDGDFASGTAFHLGDGILATAEHVFREHAIQHVEMDGGPAKITVQSTIVPENQKTDVALLRTDLPATHPTIHLGHYFEEWMPATVPLTKVLLVGYPRIPWDGEGVLVATEAEVNAIFKHMTSPHRHLLLSSSAEGGFSGGPVVSEDGKLIGMVVEEVFHRPKPTLQHDQAADAVQAVNHSGYCLAISVEPIVRLVAKLPAKPSWIPADVWRKARA